MDVRTFLILCACTPLAACSVDVPKGESQGAATPENAAPQPTEPEEPGEEGSCAITPTRTEGWRSYENGHYAFQTPTRLYLSLISVYSKLSVVKEFEGNTDPTFSKFEAQTVVQQEPQHAAYWFDVEVGEMAKASAPAERLAELAAMPQGLPPPGREHNHECGVVDVKTTTYGCDQAVEATIGCNTIRGYSYEWSRVVYHGDRTFQMSCAGSGIVFDKAEICAKVLSSLDIRD